GSGVVISLMPMLTIEFWNNKILYLLISLSLPIIFIGLYGKTIKDDFEFWYVSLLLAVALGISWVCQETGSRANHGNFGWQIIAAMWFVYYYMQKHAIIAITSNSLSFKYCIRNKVFLTLYSIHTMMGFAYLCKIIIFNDLG
ncbi:MAG: hypothetical protein M0P12_13990, partial [Paludibacteraceae bacterium]|nr:hypothetical protein [Paludibacteraceae bacterium]